MRTFIRASILLLLAGTAVAVPAEPDSLRVSGLIAAESTVDSLRAEIRKLDREIQAMKQDLADGREVDALLAALAEPAAEDPDVPADTRSRRQRVDTLLKAITQRPGQLRFNGGATMVVQDLVGGDADGGAGTGSFDLYAHTSFGPGTLLFFAFEAGGGEGLAHALPFDPPLNGDAAPTRGAEGFDHLVLNEAWAEFTALDEAVILTAGKIDLTNYFDINIAANDETAQFLAGAFVNSAALLAPSPGPGLRARTVLLNRVSLQGGVVSADSTGGTRFRDAFAIGSVGMRPFPDSPFDGNLRAYLYSPAHSGGATGWGLSADQEIADSVVAFGRFGRNDEEIAGLAPAREAWSAGLQWRRPRPDRAFVLAGAYGESRIADGRLVKVFEAYASWQVNTWSHVSPHFQVARDPGPGSGTARAVGVRVQFNF